MFKIDIEALACVTTLAGCVTTLAGCVTTLAGCVTTLACVTAFRFVFVIKFLGVRKVRHVQ